MAVVNFELFVGPANCRVGFALVFGPLGLLLLQVGTVCLFLFFGVGGPLGLLLQQVGAAYLFFFFGVGVKGGAEGG